MDTLPLIAKIALDIPNSSSFYYIIPDKFQNKLKEGHLVIVPFRSRRITGVVIEIGQLNKEQYKHINLKEIISLPFIEPVIDSSLMKFAKWISSYYLCSLGIVFKAFLPAEISEIPNDLVTKSIYSMFEIKISYIKLLWSKSQVDHFIKTIGRRAYRKVEILKLLLESDGEILSKGISSSIIKDLTDQKAIIKILKTTPQKSILFYERLYKEKKITLSEEQINALTQIISKIENQAHQTFLLHGITGSGKTEVYLRAIEKTLEKGKQAILLAPEIAITHQLIESFEYFFKGYVAIIHSRLSKKERTRGWLNIKAGRAKLVIGARSALFAPFNNLGLIIVDEEHDSSYKQEMSPKYNGRDIAILRAQISDCPVILGSATPSIESYYNAFNGKYHLLTLNTRPTPYALPKVNILDLRDKKKAKLEEEFIISEDLIRAINNALDNKKQVLIFQNRRGHSPFLICPKCGFVPKCIHCNVSLTYHSYDQVLKCHYCEFEMSLPKYCRFCKDVSYQSLGHGTQKIEKYIKNMFPHAKVARMDRDTLIKKDSHSKILKSLRDREVDILIGTQMITKGLDLPHIVLVGIVGSDNILYFPDFRAAEKTFQMITQVAGRCGRGDHPGTVLLQTFTPMHYSIKYAKEHNYKAFYNREILYRQKLSYPPYSRILNMIIKGKEKKMTAKAATSIKMLLLEEKNPKLKILGPSQAPLSKLRDQYRYQILIKAKDHSLLQKIGQKATNFMQNNKELNKIRLELDIDPINLL